MMSQLGHLGPEWALEGKNYQKEHQVVSFDIWMVIISSMSRLLGWPIINLNDRIGVTLKRAST